MHDAFVVILTSLDKLKQTDKLETWMTSIVKNVAYHYRQHVKKELETLQQMAEENKTTTEETPTPNLDDLQLLITQLPQGYQQVFRLSVFEGLSHQEISELLGIAPHSSSSQLCSSPFQWLCGTFVRRILQMNIILQSASLCLNSNLPHL